MLLKDRIFFYYLLLVVMFTTACDLNKVNIEEDIDDQNIDTLTRLQKIKQRDTLQVITDYNSTNYFIYRGTPMGYQYERAKELAEHMGVDLQITPENSIDTAIQMLNKGKGDLIAMDLTVNFARRQRLNFVDPHYQTRQMLIQRKPRGWRNMATYDDVEKHLIRSPLNLIGKKVHVQKNTAYVSRLKNLMEEMGDTIHIIRRVEKSEQLIKKVAKGIIKYTVADEHIAKVNQKYYPEIDAKTALGFPQNVAWAVKKGNDSLEKTINHWQESFNGSRYANILYNKYFKSPRSKRMYHSGYHSLYDLQLSKYDGIIKKEAKELKWDWTLLASMIYQESNFSENARSWMGAYGIMQLMPKTMKRYGIDSSASIKEQINAGIKYIKWLDKQYKDKVKDPQERKKFILAAYNVGLAHVNDAMRLAEKYDKDPTKWDGNVAYYLRRKSQPEFYRDSVVRYGYARGEEPFNYVNQIYARYQHYQNAVE